ncbi:MAG: C2 domain-containing protein [Planctomycetota bacterium]|jgi:hypothetical protein
MRSWRWLWTALTSVLVVGAVAYPFLRDAPEPMHVPPKDDGGARVRAGQAYYVLLSTIEVNPRQADGSRWDVGRAAPDVYYTASWQDTEVFRSSTKEQTLLARWSNSELGLSDVVGTVSIDDSIKAARVTARPGESIEFDVWDADLAKDDAIAKWSVPVMELRVGDQTWPEPAEGLVMVICRVLPLDDVDLGTLTR